MKEYERKDKESIKDVLSKLPKNLDLKTFEERADREGLVWEEKGLFDKAINVYDRLLAEAAALSPTSQLETNGKNAILALLFQSAGKPLPSS